MLDAVAALTGFEPALPPERHQALDHALPADLQLRCQPPVSQGCGHASATTNPRWSGGVEENEPLTSSLPCHPHHFTVLSATLLGTASALLMEVARQGP